MRKHISLWLAAGILLTLLPWCGAGCARTEKDSSAGDTPPSPTGEETESIPPAESEEGAAADENALFPPLVEEFPAVDMEGYEFHILTRGHEIAVNEMGVDELTGDTVNDAIYQRNEIVGEQFNTKISRYYRETENTHGPDDIRPMILARDQTADLIVGSCIAMMPLTLDHLFFDLNTLEQLRLDSLCWSQGLRESATIAGRIYAVSGSIALTYLQRHYALFFNKALCRDNGIAAEDVYQTVLDGGWTMDNMISLTENIYSDANGNGTADDGDIYGMGIWLNCMNDGWWSAADIPLLRHDENDLLYLDVDIDRLTTVVEKLKDFVWNSAGCCPMSEDTIYSREIPVYLPNNDNLFYRNQLCFTTMRIEFAEKEQLRGMEQDFGVLPYPKYDENQDSYYSFIHDAFSMCLVPVSCRDPQRSGLLLQALAVESQNRVVPEYYEVVLTKRYMRDAQSVEMLNILYRNTKFDSGWLFCNAMNQLPQNLLRMQVWQNKSTLASSYRTAQKSISQVLERTINPAYQQSPET